MDFNPADFSEDDDIIRSLRQGNMAKRKAEDELFNRYMYFMREGMNKYSLPEEDAFDAYADTILYGIGNIISGVFEKRSSLKTYLYKIFSNKCVDLIRKKTTNKSSVHQTAPISDMLFMLADSAKTIVQQLVERSDTNALKKNLGALGDNCRQLLGLFSEGYTDREIAQAMEYKTADVVKTSRLRCLDKLRQLYNNK